MTSARALYFPDGTVYFGEVEDGLPHGIGTALHATGEVYTGGWRFGVPSAQGMLRTRGGKVHIGVFDDGRLVKILTNNKMKKMNA